MRQTIVLLVVSAFLLSACSWVELTPEGKKIRVLSASEVSTCKKLGNTSVSVADLNRKDEVIADNLETLARNAAGEMHGDTIVPVSKVEEGKQKFAVYRCVGP